MKNITITEKDLKKHMPIIKINGKDYKHSFSASGELIDELAYCAGQWTSEELYDNNFEYEPNEPYMFNYEADLFEATETTSGLHKICEMYNKDLINKIDILGTKKTDLQAGAYMALNYPEQWTELLKAYTEQLKFEGVGGISEAYNKELQSEKDSYNDHQYREWLNGDHYNYAGVVYEIAKYFTDERDGSYTKYDDKTKTDASYTFTLNEADIETAKDCGYNKNQLKAWLINDIISAGNAREAKDKAEREKRKAERERLAIYKKDQADKAEAERKAKLLAMTIN